MLFKGNSSSLQLLIEKLQSNKKTAKDTLGTEGGSSWASEEQTLTSASSSCATPNSTTEGVDSELAFTVGITEGTPHACRFCDKAFPRHSYLKKHEQTHADCMPFRCEYCRRLFKHKRSRDRHIKLHTGDKKYRCTQCDAAFSRSDHLKIHMKTHDNQKPFQCTICNRGYNTAAALTSHMQNHKKVLDNIPPVTAAPGTTFKCLQCSEVFKKPEELQAHMNCHPISENGTQSNGRSSKSSSSVKLNCSYCSKDNFTNMESLQSHIQSAHKSAINGNAPKTELNRNNSPNNQASKSHPLTTGSSTSPASVFSSSLQQSSIASSSSSYYCELCTMQFSSLHALHKHTSSVHAALYNNNNESAAFFRYALPSDLIHEGKLYCVYCATHFLTPASFAEHYIFFHSPYQPHFLAINQPPALAVAAAAAAISEQIKPTDLSVSSSKKSPKRAATLEESMSSPRKKSQTPNNDGSPSGSSSSTPHSNSSLAQNHYSYPGTLLCSQCNAAFSDFESFRAHIKLHIEETSNSGLLGRCNTLEPLKMPMEFACPHCRSVFSSVEEINQHVVNHFLSSGMEFGCGSCNKMYGKPDDLQKHLMDMHSHHLYSCTICNEIFESKVTIQVHFAVTHSVQTKIYKCNVCLSPNAVFHTELEFLAHIRSVHSHNALLSTTSAFQPLNNSLIPLQCSICHSNFQTELDLQLHLATHGKQFQCTLCAQSFHIEYLLDKHMQQVHQNCQVIKVENDGYDDKQSPNKMYSQSKSPLMRQDVVNLKKHEPNNNNNIESGSSNGTNNLTYCDICEKSEFISEFELITHKKLIHNIKVQSLNHKMLNETSNAECNSADTGAAKNLSRLAQKCNLLKNKSDSSNSSSSSSNDQIDNVNNVIYCDICEKKDFLSESELSSHKKLVHHTKVGSPGKVSLNCAYCNETCKSRSDLENHMKTHSHNSTTSGKHKCIICDEMCPTAAVLAEHKLTHCKVLSGKTCMHCKGSITTEEQFYYHIQQHSSITTHSNQNAGNNSNGAKQLMLPTVCVICRQTLVSDMETRMHARFHLRQSPDTVPCSVCLQMVDKQELVVGICKECYQRHGKSSPFRCPECHLKFETGTAIEIHLSTVHRKLYQCIKCQLSFDNEKEIQHHVATHLMIDGHECRLCRRVLPTPLQLQAHLIEHTSDTVVDQLLFHRTTDVH